MNETARKRLRDAHDACRRIELEIIGLDVHIYVRTTTPTYAVNWLLLVLGEALNVALGEDDALEDAFPDARAANGLRNRIVRGYDSVDNTIIWDIAQNYVPRIKNQIEAALDERQ